MRILGGEVYAWLRELVAVSGWFDLRYLLCTVITNEKRRVRIGM